MGVITNFVAKKTQQISNIIITPTPNNIRYYNFTLKSLPGEVPDQALLLAVGSSWTQPRWSWQSRNSKFQIPCYHSQQHLFLKLCPNIFSCGCPWPGSSPGCWRGWTPPRWPWSSRNNKFQTSLSPQTTFDITTLAYNHFLGGSLILLFSWLLEWLDTNLMVIVIQKQQIPNISITPNNI